MIKPKAVVTKPLNILEIRYYPYDPAGQETNTQALSTLLQNDIAAASVPKGTTTQIVQPVVKSIIRRNRNTPYTTGTGETWYESLKTILTGDGADLCSYIVANNIDQVWLWKYVPTDNGGFDQERFRNWSNTMLPSGGYPPVCNGQRSFLFLGLSQTDGIGSALHTFAHSVEDTMPILQGSDLFWTRWTGAANGAQEAHICGNVHWAPNTTAEYDYTRTLRASSQCDDWNPDGTGTYALTGCANWGCDQEGYIKWWLQHMPSSELGFTYNGKTIPTWWDFLADTDNAILNAASTGKWLTPEYAAKSTPGPTATPSQLYSFFSASFVCRNPANSSDTTCPGCTQLCYNNSACSAGLACYAIQPQNVPVGTGPINVISLVNKQVGSGVSTFLVDGINLNGTLFQENTAKISYSGTWYSPSLAALSGGAAKYTVTQGNFVQFGTNATSVKLLGAKYTTPGSFDVYVNGTFKGNVVTTSSAIAYQQLFDLTSYLPVAPTPTPVAATPTPAPGGSTITFDTAAGTDTALNGIYPSGVANWGTNQWYVSSPWGAFTTKSVSFNADVASKVFNFVTAKKLVSIEAYNGGGSTSTITIACSGNTTKSQSVAAGAKVTISTGFANACTAVTIGSTNGWNTNFDNFIYQ